MKRLIYAEDAMHRIEMETRFYSGTYAEIERAIDSAPTIGIYRELNRITAEWEDVGDDCYRCPVCESIYGFGKDFKFCPECGTMMLNANKHKDGERK